MESIKKHIASSCGFSEEMESYLLGDELSEFKIIEIILGAPIPLTQKRALLESMDTPDSKITSDVSDCILEIDKALDALELKDGEKIFADAQDDAPEVFSRQTCETAI